MAPRKITYRNFDMYLASPDVDPENLFGALAKARTVDQKGRGGIRILDIKGRRLVCRKYTHGGLLRAITKDLFFGPARALSEIAILTYLEERGFPVVHPVGAMVEKNGITDHLYLLTALEGGSVELLQFLNTSGPKERMRTIAKLAFLFRFLEALGVYHPDLHLNNVLVTPGKRLIFLDFDKAHFKKMTENDMERMFWRLNRHAEKMERTGAVRITPGERMLFLRTYGRISGQDVAASMEKGMGQKRLGQRIGWFIESLLYGKTRQHGT
jgi:3-deoxy-D-manno-octulosonic acid kinase